MGRCPTLPKVFVIDYARCIGCHACEAACPECGDHAAIPRVFVDLFRPEQTLQTLPTICMHCKDAPCARSCPTQAIPITPDGKVLSAAKERCVACANCTYACPFGIPLIDVDRKLMTKCDLCHERTNVDLPPMCASVCPTQALRYVDLAHDMPNLAGRRLENRWQFGDTVVETHTYVALGADPDYFPGSHGPDYARGEADELPGGLGPIGFTGGKVH